MSRNPRRASRRTPVVSVASDEALLAGIAVGDEGAARTFVHRYERRVFGMTFAVLRDAHAAEDAAQEAFVRIWRHAGGFDARRGSVAPWVLTIARNAAIDAARLRRAVAVDPAALDALAGPSAGHATADVTEDGIEVDRVLRALRDVPMEQRRSVLMATFYGRTAAEIAEIESIPLGTAKTRIRTGLRRLRVLLDEGATR